jgi:hypothetical protein
MRALTIRLLLSAAVLGMGTAADAAVRVDFIDPERFTDSESFNESGTVVMAEIRNFLVQLGERTLPPRQNLKIEVLDIDLAGRTDIAGREMGARVVDGRADWPKFTLRYVLEQDGRVVARGEEVVADPNYLWGRKTSEASGLLPDEKRMLEKWFRERFAKNAPGDR